MWEVKLRDRFPIIKPSKRTYKITVALGAVAENKNRVFGSFRWA